MAWLLALAFRSCVASQTMDQKLWSDPQGGVVVLPLYFPFWFWHSFLVLGGAIAAGVA